MSILKDPVLRQRVAHLHRLSPMQQTPLNGIVNPDGILVSHLHIDHFDVRSLRRFDHGIAILVPHGGAVQFLHSFGFTDVRGVEGGTDVSFGPVHVRAVHAQHSVLPGASRIVGPALGYIVEGSASVYFAGDTDVFPEMSELIGTDVALLPVAGWGPRLPEGDHMNPLRAAESLKLLKPRVAIPIHWGTFAPLWARDGYPEQGAAPEQFRKHAAEIAPEVEVRVLRPGEAFTLDKREDRKTLQARATPSTAARTKPTVTTVPKADDQAAGWYTEAETPRPTMSAATIIPRTRRLPIRSSRRSDGSKPLGWRSTFRDPDSSSPMKRRTAPGASVDSQARSGAARPRRRAQADGEFISRTSRRAWGATASTKRNSGSSWSVVPSPVATA